MEDKISIVAEKIAQGGKNIAFTGAGVSTESGIPDFRSQGGIWEKFRPVYFNEFMSSKTSRIEYWKQSALLYHELKRAAPNPAHLALAKFYEMGLLDAVVTQ
ncbi:MAG: Sir2 family NAD-dependent protein deacetylase, partial [Desulfobacterales bacterium]|nr:Sir2 family NAD-dependent protein deacetylase [Desulfobacterales bacterium]